MGLPWRLSGKEYTCNAGDIGEAGSIPGSGISPGGENGNPLQYSCLEKPIGRGVWQATVQGITELDTTEWACKHKYVNNRHNLWARKHLFIHGNLVWFRERDFNKQK